MKPVTNYVNIYANKEYILFEHIPPLLFSDIAFWTLLRMGSRRALLLLFLFSDWLWGLPRVAGEIAGWWERIFTINVYFTPKSKWLSHVLVKRAIDTIVSQKVTKWARSEENKSKKLPGPLFQNTKRPFYTKIVTVVCQLQLNHNA